MCWTLLDHKEHWKRFSSATIMWKRSCHYNTRVSHVHIKVCKSLSCSPSRKRHSSSASDELTSTPSNITHPVLSKDSSAQPVSSIILHFSTSESLICPSPGRDSPTLGAPSACPSPSISALSLYHLQRMRLH